ncbi:MAG TPA: phosphomannomutase/phosphoglucomutase, partial [Methanomicrobiales archaeon]|nr:phosphomannomutase/phosphoglucomutase [Methanomicrobiales archaeon]
GLPLLERMVKGEVPVQQQEHGNGSCQKTSLIDAYIERMSSYIRNPASFRIVVDAGNGMAGQEVPLLFGKVPGWTLIPLYFKPDGRFPHHIPNPLIPSTTRELQTRVVKEGAHVGVSFDGDVDRCGFIDEKGERVREDFVTALIAGCLLKREPGATILYDLRSSRIVPETIARMGGKPVRTRVGHAFIKARMRQENALFAGELSGHYYYRDMGFIDNGLLTMVHMLNLLGEEDKPLSKLVRPLNKYSSTGEINLPVSGEEAGRVLAALEAHYPDARIDHLDGLTVDCPAWWFNIRPSHTEPVIRLNLEADTRDLMKVKKREVFEVIRETDPSLYLP